jgi:hypothetical protein
MVVPLGKTLYVEKQEVEVLSSGRVFLGVDMPVLHGRTLHREENYG